MPTCPECTGIMEFKYNIRKFVCKSCGLALNKNEIEDDWDDARFKETEQEKKEKRNQEYKDWYFKRK